MPNHAHQTWWRLFRHIAQEGGLNSQRDQGSLRGVTSWGEIERERERERERRGRGEGEGKYGEKWNE